MRYSLAVVIFSLGSFSFCFHDIAYFSAWDSVAFSCQACGFCAARCSAYLLLTRQVSPSLLQTLFLFVTLTDFLSCLSFISYSALHLPLLFLVARAYFHSATIPLTIHSHSGDTPLSSEVSTQYQLPPSHSLKASTRVHYQVKSDIFLISNKSWHDRETPHLVLTTFR